MNIATLLIKNKYLATLIVVLIILPFLILASDRRHKPQSIVHPTPQQADTESNTSEMVEPTEPAGSLSENDAAVKKRILSQLPPDQTSGVLYESATVRIDYTSGPDLFQGEIITTNTDLAKTETLNWFLSQGMSHQGFCTLPVTFYLNWDVAQKFDTENKSFSPLAPGC